MKLKPLPIDSHLDEIESALIEHRWVILQASPGSGKSTRVPARLAQASSIKGQVWVCEPRRVIAKSLCDHIASEQDWKITEQIGYQVRGDNQTRASTRLQILTEGIFFARYPREKANIEVVVLDEFHERHWTTDLAFGLLFEEQMQNPNLKVLIMSATLELEQLHGMHTIDIVAPIFPIEIVNLPVAFFAQPTQRWFEQIEETLKDILQGQKKSIGDVLVFLPGAPEIREVERRISGSKGNWQILPLHGQLSLQAQAQALKSGTGRRMILTTNIAESALTVEGVGTVVDTGIAKSQSWVGSFSNLVSHRVGKDSLTQRAGRAGRLGPGIVYRLWTKQEEAAFVAHLPAEILKRDLTRPCLELARFGIKDVLKFSWLESPKADDLTKAIAELQDHDAIDTAGEITDLGKKMVDMPYEPELSAFVLRSEVHGWGHWAHRVALVLTERDFLSQDGGNASGVASDLLFRVDLLTLSVGDALKTRAVQESSFRAMQRLLPSNPKQEPSPEEAIAWLVKNFPTHLARKSSQRYQLFDGHAFQLSKQSLAQNAEWILVHTVQGFGRENQIRWATEVPIATIEKVLKTDLASFVQTKTDLTWVRDKGRFISTKQNYLGQIPLGTPESTYVNPSAEEITKHLNLFSLLAEKVEFQNLQSRIEFLRNQGHEIKTSNEVLTQEILTEFFRQGRTLDDFLNRNWESIFSSLLSRTEQNLLQKQAPNNWNLQNGKVASIDYTQQPPTASVRLRDLYGNSQHPMLGSVALRIEILGPHFRPVQLTSDIASFWKGSYLELRKELRGRYPRHPWPDSPWLPLPPFTKK